MDFRRAFAYSPLVVVDFCSTQNVDFRGLSWTFPPSASESALKTWTFVDFRGLSARLRVLSAGCRGFLQHTKRGLSWTFVDFSTVGLIIRLENVDFRGLSWTFGAPSRTLRWLSWIFAARKRGLSWTFVDFSAVSLRIRLENVDFRGLSARLRVLSAGCLGFLQHAKRGLSWTFPPSAS